MINNELFLGISLDIIEESEKELLVWGVTSVYFSEAELFVLIERELERRDPQGILSFSDANSVVKELCKRCLIIKLPNSQYRSRMAESVRLYASLRQMFPKHSKDNLWLQAPTLVSDYRFLRRQREYPKREIQIANVIKVLEEDVGLTKTDIEILSCLLKNENDFYKLSRFQQEAYQSVLRGVRQRKSSTGSIVCAGTGSGKTLAFYLPALTHIGSELILSHKDNVQALAIYPRSELLKDQFLETWFQARKLDGLLLQRGKRKLRIGAFFGMAPANAKAVSYPKVNGWKRTGDGYACLYIRCPGKNQDTLCQGEMIWLNIDNQMGIERLVCDSCTTKIESDEIIITHERMIKETPDILFTTTEMMNRHLGNKDTCHLFGIGDNIEPPAFMLLDEVHTYSGIGGAQVGMLLRRWRYLAKAKSHFVGLSATLEQAPRFMASLTGLEEYKVAEISPNEIDMVKEGAEYMLALRGDPASRSSLLSTTIQTSMLTKRIMDKALKPSSQGVYGTRSFIFTDDMDVINRLYFQLLDAEGRYSNGNVNNKKEPLAMLRRPDGSKKKFIFGQSWDLSLTIGHTLDTNDRSNIKRTSSQDAGVDQSADVIVATASLEVGYNDPNVGAVIQHKAPRDNAQFLQRKGRAGRQRKMRPWTIVVLSDYGRDRAAFQRYEELFNPELKARKLPVNNSFVLRMQAAFATMDWLSRQIEVLSSPSPKWAKKSIWDDLSIPQVRNETKSYRQEAILNVIDKLLETPSRNLSLSNHLQRALDIKASVAEGLLWHPPRSILTAFLPTLRRRLATNWSKNGEIAQDNCRKGKPMSEFVPSALFNDLCLPELEVLLPDEVLDNQTMPILQGMKDFAPGRISKRFAKNSIRQSHWLVPQEFIPVSGTHFFPLDEYCPPGLYETMGNCLMFDKGGKDKSIPCFRVFAIQATSPPEEFKLSETSNAFLDWHTEIRPPEKGEVIDLPIHTNWANIFEQNRGLEFYTHQRHCPVEIVRFSTGSKAEMKFTDDRDSAQIKFEFQHQKLPVSIGFSLWVDAVAFRFRLPELDLSSKDKNSSLVQGLRTSRFMDEVRNDQRLTDNSFLSGWLAEVFLAAVCSEAILTQSNIEDAILAVQNNTATVSLMDIPNRVFQVLPTDTGESNAQDLQVSLCALLSQKCVVDLLVGWGELLWAEKDNGWDEWLNQCFKSTLGGALQQTVIQLCPDADEESLIVDLCGGPGRIKTLPEDTFEVWLSETDIGGGGVLERVEKIFQENPRNFFDLLEFNLRAGDYEAMDHHLFQFLETVEQDQHLALKIAGMRDANNHHSQLEAHREFMIQLQQRGFMTTHSFMSALNTRVLREGSDNGTDQLLLKLMKGWRNEEQRLEIDIPQTVYAFVCAQIYTLDNLEIAPENTESWRFNVINSLLWPRGYSVRDSWLTYYNPYAFSTKTERLLLSHVIENKANEIFLSSECWLNECHQELSKVGRCELIATTEESVNSAISLLLTEPVDMYGLHFYPRVVGVRKDIKEIRVMLDIAEAIQ